MSARGLLDDKIAEWDRDPDFILEGVLLAVNERICEVMERKGITQSELGRRLGRHRQHVHQLLSGQQNMTLRTLIKVVIALGEGIDIFIPSSVAEERERARKGRDDEHADAGAVD